MMSDSRQEILVALTVDTDSDDFFGDRFACRDGGDKAIRGWRGLEIGKDIITEGINGFTDSFGRPAVLTWFVRCDYQVKTTFGDYAYLLNTYKDWWDKRLRAGDDIQWHAHLYCFRDGSWVQETDSDRIAEDLNNGKNAIERFGIYPTTIRIGEAYHSNSIMAIINQLGLQVDSTALPGRKRRDEEKLLDWEITPNYPYHPSVCDYRTPGEPAYPFWEIPINTVATQVSYDKQPVRRYVNLAFQPGVLDNGLSAFFQEHNVLVSITHPFELIREFYSDSLETSHPLLSFRPDSVSRNLQAILNAAERERKKIRFVTMRQLLEWLKETYV